MSSVLPDHEIPAQPEEVKPQPVKLPVSPASPVPSAVAAVETMAQLAHLPFTAESSMAPTPHPEIPIPAPERQVEVDTQRVNRWVDAGEDESARAVRREIADKVHVVHFNEFNQKLQDVTEALNERLMDSGIQQNYALLGDTGPRKSKHWVQELTREFRMPEKASSFFDSAGEVEAGFPTIKNMLEEGINTFVVMDDAIYSGEQILNTIVRPLVGFTRSQDFQQRYGGRQLKILIAAPYISSAFLKNPDVVKLLESGMLEIVGEDTGVYETMPTVGDVNSPLSPEAMQTLQRLSEEDEVECYDAPLVVFDHKIPDQHSFPPYLAQHLFKGIPNSPYKGQGTPYALRDEQAYGDYLAFLEAHTPKVTRPATAEIARKWTP